MRTGYIRAASVGLCLGALSLTFAASGCGDAQQPAASGKEATGRFTSPTKIDNRWLPLKPGAKLVLAGTTSEGPHREVLIVTDVVKRIDGVNTLTLWDRDYDDRRLGEGELAFVAQDDAGNVWNFGEYPEEYSDSGKLEGAPRTWLAGVAGAKAGLAMHGAPKLGTPSYSQGLAPSIGFADRARVRAFQRRVCVPLSCYRDILVTEEGSPDEQGTRQIKYYAAGVGSIRVGFAGKGDKEAMRLVEQGQLDRASLAQVDRQVLAIDRRAYKVNPRAYGKSSPATRSG